MSDEKIISFNVSPSYTFRVKEKTECIIHKQVEVDEDARRIFCKKCGVEIDPFSFILTLAYEERQYFWSFEHLRRERDKLQQELDKLKNQVTYQRAKLKKHERD